MNPTMLIARTTRTLNALTAAVLVSALSACGGDAAKPAAVASPQAASAEKEDEHGAKERVKLGKEEAERAGIKLEALQPQSLADTLTVTATVLPNQDRVARIAPRVEGRVVGVAANLGDRVRTGQPLATLDSLALGEAHLAYLQAQAAQRVAQADFDRAQALQADEIIPRRDYLRAKADFEKASTEVRAAQDKLRLLGAAPSAASGTHMQSTFPVVAPFAGTVIEKKATLGDLANPSEPLFTVADLSKVWIEASLPEAAIAKVQPGAAATVTVTAFPNERFTGRVTYVASAVNKDTRTTGARIEIDNRDGRLKPQMFATATIETSAAMRPALTVPDAAIVLMQGQPTVFVAEGGGYEPRAIEPGEKVGGRTVVRSGVSEGEQLVAAGAYALKARMLKSQISDEH